MYIAKSEPNLNGLSPDYHSRSTPIAKPIASPRKSGSVFGPAPDFSKVLQDIKGRRKDESPDRQPKDYGSGDSKQPHETDAEQQALYESLVSQRDMVNRQLTDNQALLDTLSSDDQLHAQLLEQMDLQDMMRHQIDERLTELQNQSSQRNSEASRSADIASRTLNEQRLWSSRSNLDSIAESADDEVPTRLALARDIETFGGRAALKKTGAAIK